VPDEVIGDHACSIAIVGMACRYPQADSPRQLWENILARRRAFRAIPPRRLDLRDYAPERVAEADSIYLKEAALLEGYEFNRVRFRVGLRSYQAADLAHWLALDVASQALADAGFPEGEGLARESTGVVVGNTLTGEFSRAGLMRLRWPYVERQVAAALAAEGMEPGRIGHLLTRLEASYKEPFPDNTEESLAGGLANTIAGRIANHFDLQGGGYTVDGACSSSLLAAANACSALVAGDLDAAVVGGVDLSLDPFELVGFSRTGALARGEMRVYDRRSGGFLPGEGCGFVVLMREADALARGCRIYARIRGWGISSDGSGGLTRPEVGGQILAVRRACRRAGFGLDSVPLIEGHGTGTPVGDAVELAMLNQARREAAGGTPEERAALGSIKANIGHTKAAAGMASLIKATLALAHQILPPTTGCEDPHPELAGEESTLRPLAEPELWPADQPRRAGVSAMGFGGINTHLLLDDGQAPPRRRAFSAREERLRRGHQDGELLVLSGHDAPDLARQVETLLPRLPYLARAELTDLAAELARNPPGEGPWRAAVVATHPAQALEGLEILAGWLAEADPLGGRETLRRAEKAPIFLARAARPPRLGLLFPGQGSPSHLDGGLWRRRFAAVEEVYERFSVPTDWEASDTRVAQPAIARASLAGLAVLEHLGLEGVAAVGHSLGELVAFAWAGACDEATLLGLVTARGQAMAELGEPTGTMADLGASARDVGELLAELGGEGGEELVITGLNAPRHTVIAGREGAVERALERARERGWSTTRLAVSHAFHSPLVAAAASCLEAVARAVPVIPLKRRVSSTITGGWLPADADLPALVVEQVTRPVRFIAALEAAADEVDAFVEVGPGRVLSRLAGQILEAAGSEVPAFSIDAGGESLRELLGAVGALYTLGAPVDLQALFADRFTRPFEIGREPRFLVNPCELAPRGDGGRARGEPPPARPGMAARAEPAALVATPPRVLPAPVSPASAAPAPAAPAPASTTPASPRDLVFALLAAKTELPREALSEADRLLSDLHLNSIAVGELVTQAARRLGLPAPTAPTEYANARIGQVIESLAERLAAGDQAVVETEPLPAGVDAWVRPFVFTWVERPPRRSSPGQRDAAPAPSTPLAPVTAAGSWQLFAPEEHPFQAPLEEAFLRASQAGGDVAGGVVLLLPDDSAGEAPLLLAAGRAALAERRGPFLLVAPEGVGAAFARTLSLESPDLPVTVVALPGLGVESPPGPEAAVWAERVVDEALASRRGFVEVRYEAGGRRFQPVMRHLAPATQGAATPDGSQEPTRPALAAGEVLLVTGGGKGIGAECALALAREYGAHLAVIGRSDPEGDPELAANLARFAAHGVSCHYQRADVGDGGAVARAVAAVEEAVGPIRGLLHSAGANRPKLIAALEPDDFAHTLAPKVDGLTHLLAAVDPTRLKLVVGFGSIIARAGMPGEADYAVANERLRRKIEAFAEAHRDCRCLCVEWSVWSGVGMGARLSDLDALARQGITPIPPEAGVAMLLELLGRSTPVSVLVASRFGAPPTVQLEKPELPLLRFLEEVRLHVPGVELITEAKISADTDPYLADHVYAGDRLFPAVLGLEAMTQVAHALTGSEGCPVFAGLRFERPITAPEGETTVVRLVALLHRDGEVEVAVRSDRTGFGLDHFRARLRLIAPEDLPPEILDGPPLPAAATGQGPLPLTPGDLYGPVLFQAGRFQCVAGYRQLSATACLAELTASPREGWFNPYLPQGFLLGDPGVRDASIHGIQASIPHATVLPTGVERLIVGPARKEAGDSWWMAAEERCQDGRTLVYDVTIWTRDGRLAERWEGLTLRIMGEPREAPTLAPPLLGPYLERRLRDLLPACPLSVVVSDNGHPERKVRSERAVAEVLGRPITLLRRPDGRPEVAGDPPADGRTVSVAHAGDLVLAVAAAGAVGCDVEPVESREPEVWHDLLGRHRDLVPLLMRESGEDADRVGTRLWTVLESLKKAGSLPDAPLTFARTTTDGWTLLQAGGQAVATVLLPWPAAGRGLSIAVVAEE